MATSMRSARTRKLKFEINVVPYVDVMLVLVVILMVAVPMSNPSEVNLPDAGPSKVAPVDYLELMIQEDGAASIGQHGKGKPASNLNRPELLAQLQNLHTSNPDLPLLIAADKNVKYDDVVQMIAAAKKLGIVRVGLATK